MESMTSLLGDDQSGFNKFAYLCSKKIFPEKSYIFELFTSIVKHSYGGGYIPTPKRTNADSFYEWVLYDCDGTPHSYLPQDNDMHALNRQSEG